jgi:7-carboxy-7-deazaguanine synthase
VWQALDSAVLADWILESRRPIRLGLPIHKILWGDVPGR